MPSPLGHMIAGAAAGWLVAAPSSRRMLAVAVFAAAGAAPDLDLLVGAHSGPTHGIGAAAIAGGLAWLLWPGAPRALVAAAVAAAYATHPLLDWLSTDTSPPIGIMALWPLTTDYYLSPFRIFLPLLRRYSLPEFWLLNVRAVIRELLILVPLIWIAWWVRREHR